MVGMGGRFLFREGAWRQLMVFKDLGVYQLIMKHIIYKWRKFNTVAILPSQGRLAKIILRAQRRVQKGVKKNQCATEKTYRNHVHCKTTDWC